MLHCISLNDALVYGPMTGEGFLHFLNCFVDDHRGFHTTYSEYIGTEINPSEKSVLAYGWETIRTPFN